MPRGKLREKPRGRPRKPAVEILPPEPEPEDNQPPQQNVVEIKHKTEWSEMRPVDAPADEAIYEEEIFEPKRRRNSERDELRKKLAKAEVTPGSMLKLTIEKYRHSEAVDSQGGSFAEREHCTKYVCAEEHITSEDYLDVARKFGAGLYRFTLRMKNQVVTAWDKRISAGPTPIIQSTNPADPNSPQVIFQLPDGANGHQPVAVIDPMDQMVKTAQAYQKLKKAFEPDVDPAAAPVAAPLDPKIAALQLIADNPDVMERIAKGISSTVLGQKHGDGDPWAEVAMEAVKSGQAANMLRSAIDAIFNGINGLFPKPAMNGQAPGVQAAPAPTAPAPAGGNQESAQQVALTAADVLIIQLIQAMERNAPLKEAQTTINVAVYRHPELDESIEQLLNMSVDEIMVLLGAYHPKVNEIPHARAWLETLIGSLSTSDQEAPPQ